MANISADVRSVILKLMERAAMLYGFRSQNIAKDASIYPPGFDQVTDTYIMKRVSDGAYSVMHATDAISAAKSGQFKVLTLPQFYMGHFSADQQVSTTATPNPFYDTNGFF